MLLDIVVEKRKIAVMVDGNKELFESGKVVITGGRYCDVQYSPSDCYAVAKYIPETKCVLQVRSRLTDEVVKENVERAHHHVLSLHVWIMMDLVQQHIQTLGEKLRANSLVLRPNINYKEAKTLLEVEEGMKGLLKEIKKATVSYRA